MSDKWPQSPRDARLVVIDWCDIVEYESWNEDASEQVEAATVSTVGWLLEERPQSITVASTYRYEDGRWAGIHIFPTAPPEVRDAATWGRP